MHAKLSTFAAAALLGLAGAAQSTSLIWARSWTCDHASTGSLVQHIDTSAFGEANSVAIHNGLVAAAVAAPTQTDAGSVRFDHAGRSHLGSTTVAALPDMLTVTPHGSRLLVANEGERSASVDPSGSVSIIDVASPNLWCCRRPTPSPRWTWRATASPASPAWV